MSCLAAAFVENRQEGLDDGLVAEGELKSWLEL